LAELVNMVEREGLLTVYILVSGPSLESGEGVVRHVPDQ
jgi:hypothetical protein